MVKEPRRPNIEFVKEDYNPFKLIKEILSEKAKIKIKSKEMKDFPKINPDKYTVTESGQIIKPQKSSTTDEDKAKLDGHVEGSKTVDLELIHIINNIVKYRDDEETKKDEYETAVLKLARYWEKLGKIELAEWTLAQIGVNAWIPQ